MRRPLHYRAGQSGPDRVDSGFRDWCRGSAASAEIFKCFGEGPDADLPEFSVPVRLEPLVNH